MGGAVFMQPRVMDAFSRSIIAGRPMVGAWSDLAVAGRPMNSPSGVPRTSPGPPLLRPEDHALEVVAADEGVVLDLEVDGVALPGVS